MHQIRVHLQHLGYPIENDPVYNLNTRDDGTLSSPSEWTVERAAEQVTQTLEARDAASVSKEEVTRTPLEDGIDWSKTTYYDAKCGECQLWRPYPKQSDMLIYLHAFKYGCPLWEYQTPMPAWASDLKLA